MQPTKLAMIGITLCMYTCSRGMEDDTTAKKEKSRTGFFEPLPHKEGVLGILKTDQTSPLQLSHLARIFLWHLAEPNTGSSFYCSHLACWGKHPCLQHSQN